jgi:hypothetical protein
MNWEAVTAVSTALMGFVILVTALIGVVQLRQLNAQRRDAAAVELVRLIQDADFIRAFRLITSLPPGISASDLRARGREYEEAAQVTASRFEILGTLVYRGAISFDVMEDLGRGATVLLWDRLAGFAIEVREKQKYPMYLEWFQWLAEQFVKRDQLGQTPAHIRHHDWTPPRTATSNIPAKDSAGTAPKANSEPPS